MLTPVTTALLELPGIPSGAPAGPLVLGGTGGGNFGEVGGDADALGEAGAL
jgi:hypothetical protein